MSYEDYLDMPLNECPHNNTVYSDNNEICSECGVIINNDISSDLSLRMRNSKSTASENGRCHKVADTDTSIYKDVENLDIPKAIVSAANKSYKKIMAKCGISRGAKRKGIVVACIFYAYIEENEAKPIPDICKMFKIKSKNINDGLNKYCECFPDASKSYIMPKHLVKGIMAKTKIDYSHYQKILDLCTLLENRSKLLNSSKPQSVASTIVYLYLCTQVDYKEKLDLSKIKFSNIVGLSENTITKLGKEAQKILKIDVDV